MHSNTYGHEWNNQVVRIACTLITPYLSFAEILMIIIRDYVRNDYLQEYKWIGMKSCTLLTSYLLYAEIFSECYNMLHC